MSTENSGNFTETSKINVLMCGSDKTVKGGMSSVVNQLLTHNWGRDIQLSYLATHTTGNALRKVLFFAWSYIELKKLIAKDAFDMIHLHMSYKGSFYRKYYIAKLCKKRHKRVIIHLHGSEFKRFYDDGSKRLKYQIRELFEMADCTIVLGTDWENYIRMITPRANIQVISNAVRIPDIQSKEGNEILTFLFLGVLIKRKGVIDLLNAVKKLTQENISKFKLMIAGSGEEESALKEFVENENLESKVEFLGWIDGKQKSELLKKSDVLVLPSYNEGLPVAILEALSYALPVISTNVGSIAEAVKDGQNGYLVMPGDVHHLAESMKHLIIHRDIWFTYSHEARKCALERFSEDAFFSKIKNVYKDLYGC